MAHDLLINIVVPDIEAGALPPASVSQNRWGDVAPMSDPFGNGFCLVRFRGQGYEEVAVD